MSTTYQTTHTGVLYATESWYVTRFVSSAERLQAEKRHTADDR